MGDTYSQLAYHFVFSTKNRTPLITQDVRDDLYSYIGGVFRQNRGSLLAVGGMSDHIHLLAGWGTGVSIGKMLQLVKANSSKWMNERRDVPPGGFAWQTGYGAFTVSLSQIPVVRRYILTQEEHHRTRTFQEEFEALLRRHRVPYDRAALFGIPAAGKGSQTPQPPEPL